MKAFKLLALLTAFIGLISGYRAVMISKPRRATPALSAAQQALLNRLGDALTARKDQAFERLSHAVRLKVISADGPPPVAQSEAFWVWLATRYPLVSAQLRWQRVGQSLLLTWSPPEPSTERSPILLTAHIDTVPVSDEGQWTHPPYSGAHIDGYIWGRGTLDDKQSVLAILEAVELLLQAGATPKRDIYIAFGHDEEVGGSGAQGVAEELSKRLGQTQLKWVLDEGGVITEGIVPQLTSPIALIGIAEKGYLSLELTAKGVGGHSSMPPPQSAAGLLAEAVRRIESHPAPSSLEGVVSLTMRWFATELPPLQRWALSNLWLTAPLVKRLYEAKPSTAALLRTTTAVTQLSGSPKDNVLPLTARGVINFRMLPGDNDQAVIARVKGLIKGLNVDVTARSGGSPASDISAIEGVRAEGWRRISSALSLIDPEVSIAPYLTLGITDSRHYRHLSEAVYRFIPARFRPDDLARVHGVDERIHEDDYLRIIRFYLALLLFDTQLDSTSSEPR